MSDRFESARRGLGAFCAAAIMMLAAFGYPASAQDLETVDPDEAFAVDQSQAAPETSAQNAVSQSTNSQDTGAIDADLAEPELRTAPPLSGPVTTGPVTTGPVPTGPAAQSSGFDEEIADMSQDDGAVGEPVPQWSDPAPSDAIDEVEPGAETYGEDDLIGAAEGVFGKGAQGLAKMIENLLRDQGEPNGYIVGREAGGAFIFGARYGSGTLHHKIEGDRKVYWTGPSVGFDAGANAANTFVLVYNLFDTEDIYRRYPAGEGQAYFVGGLHASYVRRGDVVLIPIRMGAGLRLGVNAGYMRFSKKQRWLPF